MAPWTIYVLLLLTCERYDEGGGTGWTGKVSSSPFPFPLPPYLSPLERGEGRGLKE